MRLSKVLGIAETELFPPKLYANMLETGSFKAVEVSSFAALSGAARSEIRSLPAPTEQSPDALCIKAELKEAIKASLFTLPPQEREIIRLRYGIDDECVHSLKEVAHILKLGDESIRQIEAKAIRKLQQPRRAQILVDFLN